MSPDNSCAKILPPFETDVPHLLAVGVVSCKLTHDEKTKSLASDTRFRARYWPSGSSWTFPYHSLQLEAIQASDSSQQAQKAVVLFQSQNPKVTSPRDQSIWPLPKHIIFCGKGRRGSQAGEKKEREAAGEGVKETAATEGTEEKGQWTTASQKHSTEKTKIKWNYFSELTPGQVEQAQHCRVQCKICSMAGSSDTDSRSSSHHIPQWVLPPAIWWPRGSEDPVLR